MKKIIFLALTLRIILAPLSHHGDVVQYYYWSMDIYNKGLAGFYDRNIDNAVRPTYPPVTSFIFYVNAVIHQAVLKMFWVLNLIPFFPSNLIHWLESELGWFFINKLAPILADTATIILLFYFAQHFDKKSARIPAVLFAFLPPFFYNSAVWGQTDSIYGLFVICAFLAVFSNRLLLSSTFYLISILTKPTAVFAFPPFMVFWLIKSTLKQTFNSLLITVTVFFGLYLPFYTYQKNFFGWLLNFISHSLGGELNYLVANAFNFWALFFGFDNRPDTTLFLGIPIFILGNGIFIIVTIVLMLMVLLKRKTLDIQNLLLLCAFNSFTAFMFLPRMHERYFYPVLLLLLPLTGIDKKIRYLVIILSILHFINLYHFFWIPRFDWLTLFLTNPFIEKLLITINILCYLYLTREIYERYKKLKLNP